MPEGLALTGDYFCRRLRSFPLDPLAPLCAPKAELTAARPEPVHAGLPAAGVGATPGSRLGPVRRPDRRATSGGTDTRGCQAPELVAVAYDDWTALLKRAGIWNASTPPRRCR